MTQQVRTSIREPGQPTGLYEEGIASWRERREQTAKGAVVIRSRDAQWEDARQGRLRYLSHMRFWKDLAAPGWSVFEHDIRRHSGKHVHQGGLAIFVLEGRGYTVVDGVRYDWQAGDLILLPIKPGGCEHQHFNLAEGNPCRWVAFTFRPLKEIIANELIQRDVSPDWKPAD